MSRKKDDKSVSGISGSSATKGVKATSSVSEIDTIKGATAVRGVSGVQGIKGTGSVSSISFEQREKLLSMVTEEAEKLAAQGFIPKNQREVVEQAVRMIIDSALVDPGTEKERK
jgi:hypothetical protein